MRNILKLKISFIIIPFFILILLSACRNRNNDTAPDPATGWGARLGNPQFTSGVTSSIDVQWEKALGDTNSSDSYFYRLYYSTSAPLLTPEQAESEGTPDGNWIQGSYRTTSNDIGEKTAYFFTVLAREGINGAQNSYAPVVYYTDAVPSGTNPNAPFAHIDKKVGESFYHTLLPSTDGRDVYYIFTNSSDGGSNNPKVEVPVSFAQSPKSPLLFDALADNAPVRAPSGTPSRAAETAAARPSPQSVSGPQIRMSTPEILEFNSRVRRAVHGEIPGGIKGIEGGKSVPEPPGTIEDYVGRQGSFYVTGLTGTSVEEISATCRMVLNPDKSGGPATISIWVADNMWHEPPPGGQTPDNPLDGSMLDALSSLLYRSGSGNDIYDWVTDILGEEWVRPSDGEDLPGGFISGSDANGYITLFFYDIEDSNGDTTTAGYFHSKDNYLNTVQAHSNQRIMMYLDAPLFANPGDDSLWEIHDFGPSQSISTVVHEFQHLVSFYQKLIRHPDLIKFETWLNEMLSMMVEDLLTEKFLSLPDTHPVGPIKIPGPRGTTTADGSPAPDMNYIYSGRLPLFNVYSDFSVTPEWNSAESSVIINYSVVYAYGAFLLRNYGGPRLVREIARNAYGDKTAITEALKALVYSDGFEDTLQKWGVAQLLSDNPAAPEGYRYNIGDWFTFSLPPLNGTGDDIEYKLGSIDLYRYKFVSNGQPINYEGPYFQTNIPIGLHDNQFAHSNIIFRIAKEEDPGSKNLIFRAFTLGENVRLSVVVK